MREEDMKIALAAFEEARRTLKCKALDDMNGYAVDRLQREIEEALGKATVCPPRFHLPTKIWVCESCEHEVDEQERFCVHCGQRLRQPTKSEDHRDILGRLDLEGSNHENSSLIKSIMTDDWATIYVLCNQIDALLAAKEEEDEEDQ